MGELEPIFWGSLTPAKGRPAETYRSSPTRPPQGRDPHVGVSWGSGRCPSTSSRTSVDVVVRDVAFMLLFLNDVFLS